MQFLKKDRLFKYVKNFNNGYIKITTSIVIPKFNDNYNFLQKYKNNLGTYIFENYKTPRFYIISDILKVIDSKPAFLKYSFFIIKFKKENIIFSFYTTYNKDVNILFDIFYGWEAQKYTFKTGFIATNCLFSLPLKDLTINKLTDILKNIKNLILQNKQQKEFKILDVNLNF